MLFMQSKEKEKRDEKKQKMEPKVRYFSLYLLGLMLYGMGSYLFLNELVVTVMAIRVNVTFFYVLGSLFTVTGIGILALLFYQFYKRVSDKQKLRTALRNYLLLILISGLILGLLGEMIYRGTGKNYVEIKTYIWVLTTYIQGVARFVFLYYCLKLLLAEAMNWKNPIFRKTLLGVLLLLSVSIGIHVFLPVFGSVAMFTSDIVIAVGVVYKELFKS